MIKKIIPLKYDLTNVNIFAIIENVAGKIPMSFNSSRLLKIDAELTHEQLQQIRTDLLNAVEDVDEL